MPTDYGFTGQHGDAATGLDYYGARYYDPQLGQFTAADTVTDGLNRYGYVKGNPETYTDPSGHRTDCQVIDSCDSQPSDYGPGVDWGDNIRIMVQGIPGCQKGCAKASKSGAQVGPGKRVDKGDGTTPTKYVWGDKYNGAVALGFSGELLQSLIDLDKQALADLQSGQTNLIAGLVSAFFAGLGAIAGASIGGWIGIFVGGFLGAAAGNMIAHALAQGATGLSKDISALTDAYTHGESVWYLAGTMWQGHAGTYGCVIGSSNFATGGSPYDPPLEMLHAVGWAMMSQCADYATSHPASPWGNSPGIPASQDTSYSPPATIAGC